MDPTNMEQLRAALKDLVAKLESDTKITDLNDKERPDLVLPSCPNGTEAYDVREFNGAPAPKRLANLHMYDKHGRPCVLRHSLAEMRARVAAGQDAEGDDSIEELIEKALKLGAEQLQLLSAVQKGSNLECGQIDGSGNSVGNPLGSNAAQQMCESVRDDNDEPRCAWDETVDREVELKNGTYELKGKCVDSKNPALQGKLINASNKESFAERVSGVARNVWSWLTDSSRFDDLAGGAYSAELEAVKKLLEQLEQKRAPIDLEAEKKKHPVIVKAHCPAGFVPCNPEALAEQGKVCPGPEKGQPFSLFNAQGERCVLPSSLVHAPRLSPKDQRLQDLTEMTTVLARLQVNLDLFSNAFVSAELHAEYINGLENAIKGAKDDEERTKKEKAFSAKFWNEHKDANDGFDCEYLDTDEIKEDSAAAYCGILTKDGVPKCAFDAKEKKCTNVDYGAVEDPKKLLAAARRAAAKGDSDDE